MTAQRWSLDLGLDFLAQRYPVDLAMMGPSGAEAFALRSAECASALGLEPKAGALKYLDLMVLLGVGFDVDPQLPWAQRALYGEGDREKPMDELWKKAVAYLQKVAGAKGSAYKRALLRAHKLPLPRLTASTWNEASEGTTLLRSVYPEKVEAFEDNQEAVFQTAMQRCLAHDPKARGVVPLYQVLMLLLGSDFETDPRYPWAAEIMRAPPSPGRGGYPRLYAAAQAALDGALELLERSR